MSNTQIVTKEKVINALKNAPAYAEGELIAPHFSQDKVKFLQALPEIKALWVLTDYARDYNYSFIADIGVSAEKEADILSVLGSVMVHDCLFRVDTDVLGKDEDKWFTGLDTALVKEIMEGRVRTLYMTEGWGDDV